jgi:hypothetical protein
MRMVDGQVGAIMIMQRIQQGQNNYTTETRLWISELGCQEMWLVLLGIGAVSTC